MTESRPEQIESAADKRGVIILQTALRAIIEIAAEALSEIEKARSAPLHSAIEERRRREIAEQLRARAAWPAPAGDEVHPKTS